MKLQQDKQLFILKSTRTFGITELPVDVKLIVTIDANMEDNLWFNRSGYDTSMLYQGFYNETRQKL